MPFDPPVSFDALTTQKPCYAHENMTVLDPFSGSGTTAIACIETGRNFVGVEKDAHYHTLSLQRIEKARESQRVVS